MNDKIGFSEASKDLIRQQIGEWDLARRNYNGLKMVRERHFDFGNYSVVIQFNPQRIISSSAKVDAVSIEARPCFLCQKNLPAQQRSLALENDFLLLVNPFPIFPEHLTIPAVDHSDQRISGNFERLLGFAALLSRFIVFYNGPKCGASAPDHLHFQAGIKGFLPIEKDVENEECCVHLRTIDSVSIAHWPGYERGIITLKSSDKSDLVKVFGLIFNQLQLLQPEEAEPMLNILATFDDGVWTTHLVPRKQHRPSQYFETGEKQILLSPASVDMGGVLITPRESDYLKITREQVSDIFRQVCFDHRLIYTLIVLLA